MLNDKSCVFNLEVNILLSQNEYILKDLQHMNIFVWLMSKYVPFTSLYNYKTIIYFCLLRNYEIADRCGINMSLLLY
jgi:hypothetical protein